MRILVNALAARLGGGQTYIKTICSIEKIPGVDLVYLLISEKLKLPDHEQVVKILVEEGKIKSPFARVFWEKTSISKIIRDNEIDIYFCPGGSLNYVPGKIEGRRIKSAVAFQNMLPLDDKQVRKYGFSKMRIRNILLKKVFKKSMQAADLVIFTSEFAREKALDLCHQRIKKHVLIPNGIMPGKIHDDKKRPDLCPDRPYLLYVSTIDVYKAQIEVIKAYAELRKDTEFIHKLVLVGASYLPYRRQIDELIKDLGVEQDVILPGLVVQDELASLYAHADINIFASKTENCPFTLLEGMATGRPVASSYYGPMPEMAGDSVLYFNPADPEDIANTIKRYLENPELKAEFGQKGKEKVSEFNMNKMILDTWKALVSV